MKLFFYILAGIILIPIVSIFAILATLMGPWSADGEAEEVDDDPGEDVDI